MLRAVQELWQICSHRSSSSAGPNVGKVHALQSLRRPRRSIVTNSRRVPSPVTASTQGESGAAGAGSRWIPGLFPDGKALIPQENLRQRMWRSKKAACCFWSWTARGPLRPIEKKKTGAAAAHHRQTVFLDRPSTKSTAM